MKRAQDANGAALIAQLAGDSASRLVGDGDGYRFVGKTNDRKMPVLKALVVKLRASGLLIETEIGVYAASPVASEWLKRRANPDNSFRAQHGAVVTGSAPADPGTAVLVDLDESPVSALARRVGKGGEPWLSACAVAAAERLRRDFEIGGLQPRVTANWSASVATGRRSGDGGGIADLTEMAIAARLRFDRAVRAVGPELAGVLVDACCFLKGLETVERERIWPARSAKLVLRLALESLARHYGLSATAVGKESGKVRHWGTGDYRPEIT